MKKLIVIVILIGIIGYFLYPKVKDYMKPTDPPPVVIVKKDTINTPLPLDTIQVPLEINGNLVSIQAKLGGYPMKFTLDTGCSNVKIGLIDYLFLMKQGVIEEVDIDPITTINADGEEKEAVFIKMDIEVGGINVPGVNVVVGKEPSVTEPILLGHEVLEALGNIQIDYKNKILIIYK